MSKAAERGNKKWSQTDSDNAPKGVHTLGDGLVLVVRQKGERLYPFYIFRKQTGGKREDYSLGSARVVRDGARVVRRVTSLEEAKLKAARVRLALKEGRDAGEALGKKPKQSEKDYRVDAVMQRYFESIKADLKGEGEAGRWWSPVKNHVLPKLGRESVEGISADLLTSTFRALFNRSPSTGRKALTRLRGAVKFARAEGAKVDLSAFDDAKTRIGSTAKKAAEAGKRIASTPWEDVPALYNRICALDQTPARLALRLVILSAQRLTPVVRANLSDMDIGRRLWTIPASLLKSPFRDDRGQPQDYRVPLCAEAVRVIEAAKVFRRGDDLFPAQRGAGFVTDVGVTKTLNLLNEAGRTHGFRSSFKGWANNAGVSYDLSELALQHKFGDAVAQAYDRDDRLEPRREVMERWATFVTSERDAARRGNLRIVT